MEPRREAVSIRSTAEYAEYAEETLKETAAVAAMESQFAPSLFDDLGRVEKVLFQVCFPRILRIPRFAMDTARQAEEGKVTICSPPVSPHDKPGDTLRGQFDAKLD